MKQLLLTLVFLILSAPILRCQDISNPQEEITAARTRLKNTDETEKNDGWRRAIKERIALLESHLATKANEKNLDNQDIDAELKAVQALLAKAKKLPALVPSDFSKVDDISAALQIIEDESKLKKTELEAAINKLAATKEGVDQARSDQTATDKLFGETSSRLEQLSGDDPLIVYRRTNIRFARQHYAAKKIFLDKAMRHGANLVPLLEAQVELARFHSDRSASGLVLARESATAVRKLRAKEAQDRSRAEKKRADQEADPIEKFVREQMAVISRLQADTSILKNRVEIKKANFDEEETETKRTKDQLENFRQRLSNGGRTSTDSFLTRTLDRTGRNRDRLDHDKIPETISDLEVNQAQLAELLDHEFNLELPLDDNPLFLTLLGDIPKEERPRAEGRFVQVRDGKGEKDFTGLLKTYKDKITALEDLAAQNSRILIEQQNHLAGLVALDTYLRGQMFWIQSDPPMGWKTVLQAGAQLPKLGAAFAENSNWQLMGAALLARPVVLLIALVLIGLAFVPGIRKARRRKAAGDSDGDLGPEHIIEETIYSLLRIAIVPLSLMLCARVFDQDDLDPPVSAGLVALLQSAALVLALRGLCVVLLSPNGAFVQLKLLVADVTAQLLRAVKFLTAVSLPILPLHSLLQTEGFELKALERVLETIWLVGTVLVMIYLIRGRGSLVQKWTRPDGITRKAWSFVWPMLAIQMVATIVLFVLGFTIGARQLSGNAIKTLIAAIVLAVLYRVSIRLAAKSTAFMRTKMLEQGEGEAWSEASASTFQFMTRLAAFSILVIAALVIQQLWGIGANVRNVLGSLHLIEFGTEADQDYLLITYLDVFYSLLWIVGGHVIAHNIGRLYELIFVPLVGKGNKGGRYAFITLSRYAILLGAWLAALLTLQVSFEKLSWVLTATSVGIGFGLQEIVANFISGLILLFERPIRVGDIVTVGTTEGTVEKITIRATVVTNWERQTIIIPNKTFITENLTNWTRNDQIMRRTLNFGVAHGSDVEKVLRVLSEVVAGHPCVLDEPPHRIWFRGIGEFTLNFDVWIFTVIANGLRTRSELYALIYARLEEEGIKIPLPQTETRLIGEIRP